MSLVASNPPAEVMCSPGALSAVFGSPRGVVQGSSLGSGVDVERLLGVCNTLLDVQRCVLDILGCSAGVLHTVCESFIFQTLRKPAPRAATLPRGAHGWERGLGKHTSAARRSCDDVDRSSLLNFTVAR